MREAASPSSAPRRRRTRIDEDVLVSFNNQKRIDRQPELSIDQFHLCRQVRSKGTVIRLTQSAGRHVDVAVAKGEHGEFANRVSNMISS
jgi:hypothetical protein